MSRLAAIGLAVMVAVAAGPGWAEEAVPQLRITGQGTAVARPDLARIHLRIVRQGERATGLVDEVDETMQAVVRAAVQLGIDESDIQTAGFHLTPNYRHDRETLSREIIGVMLTRTMTLVVRQLDAVPELISAALDAGINQLGRLAFEVANPRGMEDRAIELAIDDAMRRAEVAAGRAGLVTGRVLSLEVELDERRVRRPDVARTVDPAVEDRYRVGKIAYGASATVSVELLEPASP